MFLCRIAASFPVFVFILLFAALFVKHFSKSFSAKR